LTRANASIRIVRNKSSVYGAGDEAAGSIYMGFKEDLKESHSESVKMLEAAGFQWVNQDPDGKPWPSYILVKRDGAVVKFSYKEIADHSVHWIRERLAAGGF
jgi:hypothetical protein